MSTTLRDPAGSAGAVAAGSGVTAHVAPVPADDRFTALVRALAAMVWRVSPDGTVLEYDGWAGTTGGDVLGTRGGWASHVHPDDLPALQRDWESALASGRKYQRKARVLTKDRGYRWFRVCGVPIRDAAGRITEWVGVTQDVHDEVTSADSLLKANTRLHAIITLQSEIATRAPDEPALMQLVAERLITLVQADVGAVALPADADLEFRVSTGTRVPDALVRVHRGASLTGWCFEHLQSVRCGNISADERVSGTAQRLLGVHSLMLVPLAHEGHPLGVLAAMSRRRDAFGEDDLSTMELLAGILAAAMVNARANRERQLLLAERSAALDRSARSEEKFRALAEHSDELIHLFDPQGNVRYVSPSVERILGWSADEVEGTSALDWVHPEDRPAAMAVIAETAAGKSRQVTFRVRHKDGTWRHLEFMGRNLTHIPAIGGIASNARDVTEKVRAAAAIEFQAQLLQTVQQAVVAIDLDGRITYWNHYAESLYGWSTGEAIGAQANALIAAPGQDAAAAEIMALLARGESWRGEYQLRRKDGSSFVGYVVDTPVYDQHGRMQGFVGVSFDLTERHALENQLRQAQKMEAVGQLAGGVAHDFNNILTAITSYTELLLQDEEDAARREDLLEVKGAARRAADLTGKLLAFSRQQVMQVRVVDVREVLRGLESLLSRVISEDVQLVTCMEETPLLVKADATQLEQVILNLVVNARDAMPQGGTVRVRLRADAGECELKVSDSGMGMTEEVRARIFEPFFTTKPQGKGTGLGLAVVYGIVQQSKGTISVTSAPGEGAEFTVRLPLARETPPVVVSEPAIAAAGDRTILVADDNPVLAELARRVLTNGGYRVVVANSAEAAAKAFDEAGKIDLLLTDVVMPGGTGKDLVARLRERGRQVAVVFTSGFDRASLELCPEGGGGPHFLAKPWTPQQLLATVRAALDGHDSSSRGCPQRVAGGLGSAA